MEIKNERNQWRKDRGAELNSKFLYEMVMERYKTYPAMLKVLGAIRDILEPDKQHWKSLVDKPNQLEEVANSIIDNLYGEAGLVMSMETRNALLETYYACHLFGSNEISLRELVNFFFEARRQLRSDLQIEDLGKKSELSKIWKVFAENE